MLLLRFNISSILSASGDGQKPVVTFALLEPELCNPN